MKKFILGLSAFLSIELSAQTMPYAFSVLNEPYTPLTDSISVNAGEIWDDPEYIMPIGFTIQVIDEAWTQLLVTAPGSLVIGDLTSDSIHLLLPILEDICDVGLSTGISQSPMSYKVDGEAGQQIFKLEWSNVGFYQEFEQSSTNYNTLSFQMWLYEGSNIIEYRYGPSAIKGGNFFQFGGPLAGICEDYANGTQNTWQSMWYTSNDPIAPSIEIMDPNNFQDVVPLTSMPVAGTVYRFSPLFVNQSELSASEIKIFPTIVDDRLWIQTKTPRLSHIQILDLSGNLIHQQTTNSTLQEIDVNHLPSGVYFIRIDGLAARKFIKK